MSRNPAEDVLNELLPYFEAIETQNAALVQFLKDKRVVSDEQLAPYLERAAKASNVKWLGARLRMGRLFSVPETKGEGAAEKPEPGQQQTTQPSAQQRTTQPSTDGGKHPEERQRGETAKKSEGNTDSSGDKTADSPGPSERTTKSSSSEPADSEKDKKAERERDADADKNAA
jgi:hypothetical protein